MSSKNEKVLEMRQLADRLENLDDDGSEGMPFSQDEMDLIISVLRGASNTLSNPAAMTEQYADVLRIQKAEAASGDPYMVGLYNGMLMMCCNVDNTEYTPLPAVKRSLSNPAAGKSKGTQEQPDGSAVEESRCQASVAPSRPASSTAGSLRHVVMEGVLHIERQILKGELGIPSIETFTGWAARPSGASTLYALHALLEHLNGQYVRVVIERDQSRTQPNDPGQELKPVEPSSTAGPIGSLECADCGGTGHTPISVCLCCGGTGYMQTVAEPAGSAGPNPNDSMFGMPLEHRESSDQQVVPQGNSPAQETREEDRKCSVPAGPAGATPETDALAAVAGECRATVLARKLERERDDAREVAARNLALVDELRARYTVEKRAVADLERKLADSAQDAARYRWWTENYGTEYDGPGTMKLYAIIKSSTVYNKTQFDAAIDTAIARERT